MAAVYGIPLRYSTASAYQLNARWFARSVLIVGYNIDKATGQINRYLLENGWENSALASFEGHISASPEFLEATVMSVTVPKSTLTEEMRQVWESEARQQVHN